MEAMRLADRQPSGARVAWALATLTALACGGKAQPEPAPAPPPAAPTSESPRDAAPFVRFVQDDQPVSRAQIGAPVTVQVEGMPKGAAVTLRASMRTKDQAYASWATFTADAKGHIDTQTQSPIEGTWSGADPDAIVWSMAKVSSSPIDLDRFDLRVVAEVGGREVAAATLARFHASDAIRRSFVSSPVRGVLYAPTDAPARGALLVLGGDAPGVAEAESVAAWWATRGYVTLALAHFGEGALPPTRAEIPLEYFGGAIDWLSALPEVSGKKVVAMGASRGGELALLLGATFPKVSGVVAEAPSGLVWGATRGDVETASWTYRGSPVAWVPSAGAAPTAAVGADGEMVYRYAPAYEAALEAASPAALSAATTPVEYTIGPVLLFAGDDDGFWPACELSKVSYDRLLDASHLAQYGDYMICYPDAGHVLGLPGMPTTDVSVVYDATLRRWLSLGGTPQGTARAQRDIYRRVTTFVDDVMR
jgi:pimeloyl-ACP methyl ester carboxylesterase